MVLPVACLISPIYCLARRDNFAEEFAARLGGWAHAAAGFRFFSSMSTESAPPCRLVRWDGGPPLVQQWPAMFLWSTVSHLFRILPALTWVAAVWALNAPDPCLHFVVVIDTTSCSFGLTPQKIKNLSGFETDLMFGF